ncbi:hypothetical protein HI814_14185 [Ralstonia solanacearum]|jgi:hypothetical protein|nr:hypothetical protein HI814_14185 [Ralstonia solanacearum]QKM33768.1 hypothetical protein HI794_14180 [Ralstonia solanacearum]QKM38755.1 hypothetical protein HI793_14190 [Ralstonia solanacearum]
MNDKNKTILFLLSERDKLSMEFRLTHFNEETIMIRTKLMNQLLYVRSQLNLYSDREIKEALENKIDVIDKKLVNLMETRKEVEKEKDGGLGMVDTLLLLNIAEKDAFLSLVLYQMEVRGIALFAVYEMVKLNNKEKRL